MDEIKYRYGSYHPEYIPHHFEKAENRSEKFDEMPENTANANIRNKFDAV
jgi:hypothetical protein